MLAAILTAIVLLFLALPLSLVAPQLLAVIAVIWVGLTAMIVSGAEGREEAQRIIERPFDERERAIRTNALAIGLAAVVLFNLGWVVYGIAGGHDALAPALTILLSGASIVIAVEVLRRRGGMAPATGDDAAEAALGGDYLAEALGRPTWIATVIAWLLAILASSLLISLLALVIEVFGIPKFLLTPGADEHLGAIGLGADIASFLFTAATSAIQSFIFCLVASRWLNRSVSFAWIFAFSLASLGLALLAFPHGGVGALLLYSILSLFVLRYLAASSEEARGIGPRVRLTRPVLAGAGAATVLSLFLASGFATTHPLSVVPDEGFTCCNALKHLAPEESYSYTFDSPTRVDLRDSLTVLDFHTHNRGLTDLTKLRITGIESSPAGAATIQSLRPGRGFFDPARLSRYLPPTTDGLLTESLPSHKQKAMKLRIKFDCSGPQSRVVTLTGLKFQYEAWGREWGATVPMDKLTVTCPR